MADITSVLPISKNRDVNELGNEIVISISDGTTSAVVDAGTGALKVYIAGGSVSGGGMEDEDAFTQGTTTFSPIGGDFKDAGTDLTDGQAGVARVTAKRAIHTNLRTVAGAEIGTTASPVGVRLSDGTNLSPSFDAAARKGFVAITDGTVTFTAAQKNMANSFPVVIASDQSSLPVSKDGNANAETNPIFVQITNGAVSGKEVQDYDTSPAVAAAATDDHDYASVSTTFLLTAIHASASGAMRVDLKIGPVASLVTKGVWFTSMANPNVDAYFDPPLEVPTTSTGTTRLSRTNRETVAMDVYSTIVGRQV